MSTRDSETMAEDLGLTAEILEERLAAIGLSPADRLFLKDSWEKISEHSSKFLRRLYQRFQATPEIASLLQHETRIERLILLQSENLRGMFSDPIDRGYVLRRLQIGLVHHRIRVTPQWYLAAFSHFLSEHVDLLLAASDSPADGLRRINILQKSVLFDASLSLDAYGRREEDCLSGQRLQDQPEIGGSESDASGAQAEAVGSTSPAVDPGAMRIRLSETDTASRAAFIGLEATDLEHLRSLRDTIARNTPAVLAEFYSLIQSSPALNGLVRDNQVRRLIQQVSSYWKEFVDGHYDRPHAASRMRIGVIHEQIGLEPQWYLAGLSRQVSGLLMSIPPDHPRLAETIKAFFRALFFDITFVIDAYMEARANSLLQVQGYASQLLSGLTSAVVVVDSRRRIQFANESFLALAGIDAAILYLMELSAVITLPELRDAFLKLQQDGVSRVRCLGSFGNRLLRMTVTELDVSIEKHRRSTAVVFDDISDMMRLSHSIQQDSRQYQRLTNIVSAVLWEMDWQTQIILSISHTVTDLLGNPDASLLGRQHAWIEMIVSEDQSRFEACCSGLEKGQRSTCEYRMLKSDGSQIWVRSDISRLHSESMTFCIAAITLDITMARQSDQLRLAALEHFASGIAHLINNSLTVITGNIELHNLSQPKDASAESRVSTLSGTPNRRQDLYLSNAIHAANAAAAVVSQLQSFAKGQFLRPSTVKLSNILKQSLPDFRSLLGTSVRLHTEFAPNLWSCRVDPLHLVKAISQLCDNARRAMPGGGEVQLQVRNTELTDTTCGEPEFGGEWIEITVSDTGSGMTAPVRKRAIEPFFSTSPMTERLGLGLSMVHGFVMQSGGHLVINSQPGSGTSVILRFPRQPSESSVISSDSINVSQPTILIVDSDESVRQSTKLLIEQLGYHVVAAEHADEAVQVISQQPVDLLLTEILLKNNRDGVALAQLLTASFPFLSVVLMTGIDVSFPDINSPPKNWGRLKKPFTAEELASCLRTSLERRISRLESKSVLSPREREVLHWIASGKSQVEVALILGISERTVEQHVRNARQKLNAVNTVQTIAEAITRREISP